MKIDERYKINSTLTGLLYKLQGCESAMETIVIENQYPATAAFILTRLGQTVQEIKDLQTYIKEVGNEPKN